ncbi:MAG: aldehyde dehydrogenase family protein [bacterium]
MTVETKTAAGAITSINPATLEVNAEIPATPPQDIKGIVEAARDAQARWAAMSIGKRVERLRRARDFLIAHMDDAARVITADNGKSLVESANSEIYPVLDMFRFCERDAPAALAAEKVRNPVFPLARIESVNVFEPAGVVGIISPWNFPFAIPMTQMLMALTAGNAVVFKPASLTAWVGDWIRRMFERAGMPEGVVNVVQGAGGEIGDALLESGLNRIAFTGSVPVGMSLMAKAARTLTPITLELGGKDPFIVLEDADVERASSAAVWGSFVNAGQACASVERVYVDRRAADVFIAAAAAKTKRLRVGNGMDPDTDMGPLISADRLETVESHVADAVSRGARVIAGGGRIASLPGYFFEPTVLTGVDHSMLCMTEETFGPTLPIMTFSGVEEAVALANDSKYGLTASVWSGNVSRAKQIAGRINTGTVVVNDCLLTYGFAQCPWGGVKQSGIGRTHSVHGLYEFTNIKNLTTSRALLRQDPWWYPYSGAKYRAAKSAMKALFGDGVLSRGGALVDAFKAFRSNNGR